jgi:YjbE family integral membrane protein
VDLGPIGSYITWDMQFLMGIVSIIVIDLILAGDNAVIIAMAVRRLPKNQRITGTIFGAGAAVLLRVALTFFVSQLLQIIFLKLIGGIVILWIAVKLFVDGGVEEGQNQEAVTMGQAVRLIVIADVTMSIDNVLAIAGASRGNLFLLFFGLALSIPLVVFTSNVLSVLMDKYPIIILLGAAVLGRVGGEMMITDAWVEGLIHPSKIVEYGVQIFFAVGVIVVGKLWIQWKNSHLRKRSGD